MPSIISHRYSTRIYFCTICCNLKLNALILCLPAVVWLGLLVLQVSGIKKVFFSNCQVVTFFLKRHTIFFPFVVGNKLSHILEAITFHSPMQLKQSLRFSRPDLRATSGEGLQWNGKIDLLYPSTVSVTLSN